MTTSCQDAGSSKEDCLALAEEGEDEWVDKVLKTVMQEVSNTAPGPHGSAHMVEACRQVQDRFFHALHRAFRSHDPKKLRHVLHAIFDENSGHEIFEQRRRRDLKERELIELVDDLRYSHDEISHTFRHGPHGGQPLKLLV
eukprot:CAMPEP_0180515932 /NCGR_PEP_ID=MMETSP1036_2-20121128/53615_1 /TAXON_ID=632150 /ORGANISM="Azadinium spinosum, Strain 3D9" /LENGTH=140 /DNA_ID=CAMNT_0022527631 /DNA_START=18 /DNA_END=436 /DNA_ORIENTATION=-